MLSNKKFFSILTIAFATVAFSAFTFAQDPMPAPASSEKVDQPGRHFGKGLEGKRGFGRHGGAKADFRGLNLTDAQKARIKSIRDANKPDKANFDNLKAIREAHKNGTPITDEQKAQLKAFREQSQATMKSVHDQIQNVLTPEQKAQIEAQRAERKQLKEQLRQDRPAKPVPAAPTKPITN